MFCFTEFSRRYESSTVDKQIRYELFDFIKIYFSLPLADNTNAIDYVIPDYNEIKQGSVQSPLSSISVGGNADSSKKTQTKQQQVYEMFNSRIR
jgi:hypothetical protein